MVNAIDLLKKDHEVVADLFEQVRNTPESKHSGIFTKIKAELDVHAHIEETVLYPRLKKDGTKKLADITSEGIEEHHQIKMFLKELDGARRQKDIFEAKLKVLIEDVEHHVDEEEDEMFPLVEDQFSDAALEKLGTALENKKQKFIAANPDIAKGLVKRRVTKNTGTLETIYDKAMTAVQAVFSGNDGKSTRRTGKKAANGKMSPSPVSAVNGSGRTTGKGRTRASAPANKKRPPGGLKRAAAK